MIAIADRSFERGDTGIRLPGVYCPRAPVCIQRYREADDRGRLGETERYSLDSVHRDPGRDSEIHRDRETLGDRLIGYFVSHE